MWKKICGVASILIGVFLIYCWMPAIEDAFRAKYGYYIGDIYLKNIENALCIILAQGLIFGFITIAISKSKGYDGGFWWGFFLGILGLIVVAVRPDKSNPEQDKSVKAANYTQALERLASMRDHGILTEAEFNEKKQEILKRI